MLMLLEALFASSIRPVCCIHESLQVKYVNDLISDDAKLCSVKVPGILYTG